jgi:hypothetical protein
MNDGGCPRNEALRGGYLGDQSGAHGTLWLQDKCRGALVVARSNNNRLDGDDGRNQRLGSRREAATSDHVGAARAGKPREEQRCRWAAMVASGRDPRMAM